MKLMKTMKPLKLAAAVLALTASVSLMGCQKNAGAEKASAALAKETVFSKMETVDLSGNKVDSSIFKENKITLVNGWNIGCTPCIQELPELEKLNKAFEGKGVAVKGLYFDSADGISEADKKELESILSDANATYQQFFLSKEMSESTLLQDLAAFPTTYIVDSEGTILDKIEGSNDFEGWKAVAEKYLEQVNAK